MYRITLYLIFCIGWQFCAAQQGQSKTPPRDTSSVHDYISLPVRTACKSYALDRIPINENHVVYKSTKGRKGIAKKSALVVHGNVLYDLNYWSNIDTPYAERSVYQHTLQTYLDIDYKDSYPFRVYFTTRWGNSSLFRNITDVNLGYSANDFRNRVRRQVEQLLLQHNQDSLAKMEKELRAKEKEYNALQAWLKGPDQWQKLMAERERLWFKERDSLRRAQDTTHRADSSGSQQTSLGQLPNLDQMGKYKFGSGSSSRDTGKVKTPAADSTFPQRYDSLTKRLDSLGAELALLERSFRLAQRLQSKGDADTRKQLGDITSGKELQARLDSAHVSDSSLPKGYKTLYSIRSFGIGRTLLDYSELSVKNVSINGVELEYNPSTYMAVAAGTVDYRYQDYTINNKASGQYVAVVRYGWGKKDGNNIILTYYTGRRQLYNIDSTTNGGAIPNYNLMGFTVAGRYRLGRTSALIAEVAKSSTPYYSLDSSQPHHVLGSTLKFSDRSNEAYSLKFTSLFPRTQTAVNATWTRYGANFQSFSLFTSGSQQTAWSVRVDQPFFQRHLLVTGSVKTNDYINPLISTTYKTTAVFESVQATWRMAKWPTLSVGFSPSSQIVKLSDNQYQANLFYMFNASATESYKYHSVSMMTMLLYTRFYNKVTDTGFVYYNTKNLLLSQMAMVGRWIFQLQASAATNPSYELFVLDGKTEYKLNKWLSLGGGLKYNIQTVYNIRQWGYSGLGDIRVPKIGEFRMSEDWGFIPGNNKQLVPNTLGRLTYIKVF